MQNHQPLNLRWIGSVSASSLHAAHAVACGKTLADPRLANITELAQGLRDEILQSALPPRRFWRQLLSLAHQIENNRELATVAIRKTVGSGTAFEPLARRLADQIAALESAVLNAVPGLVDELELRSRPIRELWEARGPGMLHAVGQSTESQLIVEQAEVVLVLPALGGGGAAHLSNNSVRLEAVLTNNVPLLPEVVRLAWLLAQLHCDLPIFSETLSPDRLPVLAQFAMLPPVLQASETVELAELHLRTLSAALAAWHLDMPATTSDITETLLTWWQTYRETRPAWKTALAALDQMLPTED